MHNLFAPTRSSIRSVLGLSLLMLAGAVHAEKPPWPRLPNSSDIHRLPPDAFSQVPSAIRKDLEHRGCTIPQNLETGDRGRANNIVTGRFRTRSSHDWAALCSHDGSSFLIVYWNGNPRHVYLGDASRDVDGMQWMGPQEGWVYSLYLGTATPQTIRRLNEQSEDGPGSLPTPLDHDGLESGFAGKASTILYWHHGRLLTLAGAD